MYINAFYLISFYIYCEIRYVFKFLSPLSIVLAFLYLFFMRILCIFRILHRQNVQMVQKLKIQDFFVFSEPILLIPVQYWLKE